MRLINERAKSRDGGIKVVPKAVMRPVEIPLATAPRARYPKDRQL